MLRFELTAITFAGVAVLGLAFAAVADAGGKHRRIDISVTEEGFTPKKITVKKGEETMLVFTRKTDKTCAKKVVVHLDEDKTITKELPLDKPVMIHAKFAKSGKLGYVCGMGHVSGIIVVR